VSSADSGGCNKGGHIGVNSGLVRLGVGEDSLIWGLLGEAGGRDTGEGGSSTSKTSDGLNFTGDILFLRWSFSC